MTGRGVVRAIATNAVVRRWPSAIKSTTRRGRGGIESMAERAVIPPGFGGLDPDPTQSAVQTVQHDGSLGSHIRFISATTYEPHPRRSQARYRAVRLVVLDVSAGGRG